MPTNLLIMSDTHLPRRAADLPAPLWDAVDAADVVVHAGDWVDLATLDRLEERATTLLAVRGNNDGPEFDDRLPLVAHRTIDGVRVAVVHETGPAAGREARVVAAHPDTDLLVFGHSHIPWDTTADSGMRLVNPGSPTDRRRQPDFTWMTATLDRGGVEVALVRLTPADAGRGRLAR